MLWFILPVMVSCGSGNKEQRDIVTEWIGKKLIIPDSLQFQIGDIPIDYDFNDADYKIVTYIDSAGCTGCKMRLDRWEEFFNDLKKYPDISVNYLMIINSDKKDLIYELIRENEFKLPIVIDSLGMYDKINSLPKDERYQTFLLDSNNEVCALGNPVFNPKIKDIYKKYILEKESESCDTSDTPITCYNPVQALGTVYAGDTIRLNYRLINKSQRQLSIQDIITSCNCVTAVADETKVKTGGVINIEVSCIPENKHEQLYRYVDIYFEELQNPVRLYLYGFII